MKKNFIVASLIASFASVASFAATMDSSNDQATTISTFGVIDLGLQKVTTPGQSQLKMVSGSDSTSRLGWTATRPLQDDLNASIWLEAGLTPTVGDSGGSNGSTTVLFNRRSTLSLTSILGELRVGRDYSPTYLIALEFDPFATIGVAGVDNITDTTLGSAAKTSSRSNNQVQLIVPKASGIYGGLSVAPSDGTAAQGFTAGRVGYTDGNFDSVIGMSRTQNPGFSDFVRTNLGVSYQFSSIKLNWYSNQGQFGSINQTLNELSAVYKLNPKDIVRASYTSAKAAGSAAIVAKDTANMVGLGYKHQFDSKTAWYATYSQIQNKNSAAFGMGSVTPLSGATISGYESGLEFKF